MPKAILEFNLPEEEVEFRAAQEGLFWHAAMQELDEKLRVWLKYGLPSNIKEPGAAIEAVRALIVGELETRNLSLWG